MAPARNSAEGTAGAGAPNAPSSPRKYRRRLANLKNVRAGLADVIRKLELEELEPRRGNALVYAYSALAGIIQGSEVEERLAALEGRGFPAKAAKARIERAGDRRLTRAVLDARPRP